MAVIVDVEQCIGCGMCEEVCPSEAILVIREIAEVDEELCDDCGTCIEECPEGTLALDE